MITTAFKDAMPEPGRTVVAVWKEPHDLHEGAFCGYARLFYFGREPYSPHTRQLKMYHGDCRTGMDEVPRAEQEAITQGRWVYLSDIIADLREKGVAIEVEVGTDETNPWIRGRTP